MGLFEKGMSTSAIGTHRSALSMFLPKLDGFTIGEHPLMVRFMKGLKNQRPSYPRYAATWDTDVVVKFLKGFDHTELKALTHKITMILALITAQRAQTLSKLRIK